VTAPFRLSTPFVCALIALCAWARGQTAPAAVGAAELPADIAALLAAQPAWSNITSLQAGLGYKDNVLLSHIDREQSGFARAGVEEFLWHVPRSRIDYFALVNAEETRYFTSKTVDREAHAIAQMEWCYRVGDTFKFSLDGQGYYLDQIFDVSNIEVRRTVAEFIVTGATLGPTIRWAPTIWCWIEAQGVGKRETYRDGLNNNRLGEGALRLGWRPSPRCEVSLGGTERWRDFDHRTQYNENGFELDDLLKVTEREGELRIDATWDAAAHWKTSTRAGLLHYIDNGSGFFNYHQRQAAQELEWAAGDWLVRVEGRAQRTEFEVQTVGQGIGNLPPRVKDEYAALLRIERKIAARWTAFAEYSWERSRCNDQIASYRVNQGLLGARWSWEK
jgi:hypothetical protein